MAKPDADEKLRMKRLNYLDSALVLNRLLDNKYFPDVVKALKKGDKGKTAFEKICKKAEVPEGMIGTLWKTLVDVDSKMAQEPGWIPGM